MAPSMGKNADYIRAQKWGFWIGTKLDPRRAVRWEAARHEDGREKLRGHNWVEVMAHGDSREPDRFAAADVEMVGPHEWLSYYPAVDEPVCGWGRPRLPDGQMQYCPATRAPDQSWCARHMTELERSEGEEQHGPDHQGPDTE